jgi:hypothetical protein
VVTSAKLNGDSGPTLKVGNRDVQLSTVTEVQQTAAAPPPATPSSSTAPVSASDSTPTA